MPSPSILVSGGLAYDLLLSYDREFAEGLHSTATGVLSVCFRTNNHVKRFGGVGANIAWNLRLLHQEVTLVASLGADGDEYRQFLTDHGIRTEFVKTLPDVNTATYIASVDTRHNLISFYSGGADMCGSWPDITGNKELYPYAIIGPRTVDIVHEALTWCKQSDIPVFFDPGQGTLQFHKDIFLDCLAGCAGLIVNECEWDSIAERFDLTPAAVVQYAGTLIITRAERGVSFYCSNGIEDISSCTPDRFANPTGAGDGFRAGFLTGLMHGWSRTDAGRLGCALASFVVEEDGPLLEQFSLDVLYERANATYSAPLPAL